MNFSNRVVLVTGASRGLGEATAKLLAKKGAAVTIISNEPIKLGNVERAILDNGGRCLAMTCDVKDGDAVQNVVDQTVEKFGKITDLVNNAGVIQPLAMIEDADPEAWKQCVSTHIFGSFHCVKAVIPHLKKQSDSSIINISSGASEVPLDGWSGYNCGKAALKIFSAVLHQEVNTYGIRVYSLRPGGVDSRMQDEIREAKINDIPHANIPKENLMPAIHAAKGITRLIRDEENLYNGQELDVRHPPLLGDFENEDEGL